MFRVRFYQWSLLLLVAMPMVCTAATNGFDVVTLKNGDIYNGTVAQSHFTLVTRYGEVPVPYGQMVRLILGREGQPDRILTRRGDHFSGRLKERELTVLRVLDPTLPVAVEDVSGIRFVRRNIRPRIHKTPDAVITQSGDRFAARVITEALMMTGRNGLKVTNASGIHLLDVVSLNDGEDYLAQITANDGAILQGKFALEQVTVVTSFGTTLTIPFTQLSQLALRVNHSGKQPAFRFLQRLNPADLIQDRMRDGTLGPQMLALRGGAYLRGDLQGDGDGDEQPPAEVRVQPFAIAVYEATFDEYDLFCDDTGRGKPDDEGWGRGSRPVVNVSWEDANSYAEWLSQRTEQRYRLPTDAEWEYAARGGTSSRFWWGDEAQTNRANCADCGSLWESEKSAPVGRFPPNPFGLHDTAGNVFEWVADCWQDSYGPSPSSDGGGSEGGCGKRVIRGGAWSFPVKEVRSANRWRDFPTRRSDDTGFRLARELSAD